MARDAHHTTGIGAPVPRVEDARLLRGGGRYTGDFYPPGVCHAAFVRSPHAHARIRSVETAAAAGSPGVLAVLTGADVLADRLGCIPHGADWAGGPDVDLRLAPGREVFVPDHPVMAHETVRHVGEPVAMVVAHSRDAALDAATLVAVDYEPLEPVVGVGRALAPDTPAVWPDWPDNTALVCEVGDRAATEAAFARAAHVVRFEGWAQRVTGCPMEPRSVLGEHDAATGRYTLRTGSGRGVVQTRERLATILGVALERCRTVCGDMGGNFGTRNAFAPEFALVPWAAGRIGRPVRWTAERTECFTSDYQGRDLTVRAELALDAEGSFLALRGRNVSNLGAYAVYFSPLRKGLGIMQGVYRIPCVHFEGLAVFTHTMPTAVYRSAGRPEAIYVIERLVDLAARECGFDRMELRRRNLVPADAMPWRTPVGITYDSGDYAASMERALALADWEGFPARRAESARRGLRRGIAAANYIEATSGIPRERAEITVSLDGTVELVLGTLDSGQGHSTTFAQLVAEWLGAPLEAVRYVTNDTDRVSVGGGSHSGRSMRIASLAIADAVEAVVERGRALAAHALQARPEAIVFRTGRFRVSGGEASMGLFEAAASAAGDAVPPELGGALAGVGDVTVAEGAYPSGTHVCEVEVDPETGHVQILAWSGVDDVGLAINPLVLHGQAHGAVAQGVGQALLESCHYDPETGQLLAASFMDYALPRADTLPFIASELAEVPATSHRIGIRPGGEGGTTPALAVVVNAIVHALADLGVRDVAMPATPERVWRAIRDARSARGDSPPQ